MSPSLLSDLIPPRNSNSFLRLLWSAASSFYRDALQCKARSCDRMSSVRPSVCRSVCDVACRWFSDM